VVIIAVLPATQFYVQRLVEGLLGQDLATQMRFGEYKDAVTLISRYPWLGVGFSGTPEIDTYLGVSSVYLLIAEEMGLIGLAAFLVAAGAFLAGFFRTRLLCPRDSELEPILLGTGFSVVGAMVGGIFDHYFFNLDFPHAAALFWLVVGLGVVAIRLVKEQSAQGDAVSAV
jgi:O-antigen ligase